VKELNLQIYSADAWHDAAVLTMDDPARGVGGSTTVNYSLDYVLAHGIEGISNEQPVKDYRALSLAVPVTLETYRQRTWPAFLVDLMPQGAVRDRILREAGLRLTDPAGDIHLLLHSAGTTIGNLRVKEAAQMERERLRTMEVEGITRADILDRSPAFREMAERFAYIAGSSGLQGEWPKFLCTRAMDGLYYPDSCVPDEHAVDHFIIKMLKSGNVRDGLILASEAPYIEVARRFGLHVGRPLDYSTGILMMPRFDRAITPEGVLRFGQESMVSAIGVAEYGHIEKHETYLARLQTTATDPAAETSEYVRRDVLNMAMGDVDNHGRNTAIQKRTDGFVGLTPLFDFAPMRLDDRTIMRTTKWACLGGKEMQPDWVVIAEAAAGNIMSAKELMADLSAMEPDLRRLPEIATDLGVPEEVCKSALSRHEEIADSLAKLKGHINAQTQADPVFRASATPGRALRPGGRR